MSLQHVFESNRWVKAWLNAPDDKARGRVISDMGKRHETLGGQIMQTPVKIITDEQLKELRELEVAAIVTNASDPNSRMTRDRVAKALEGKSWTGGFLMSKQMELHREEARGPQNEGVKGEKHRISVDHGTKPTHM